MKNCLGIEIGHYRVKIAYMEHGELQTYVSERLETENQTDMKVYAELIKALLKENNIPFTQDQYEEAKKNLG